MKEKCLLGSSPLNFPKTLKSWAASALLLGSLLINAAWADPVVGRLYANMHRGHMKLSVPKKQARAVPTLVKGLYRVEGPQGRSIGFTNAEGTLYGGSDGFSYLPADGSAVRRLTEQELADLRSEIVAGIDTSQLIRVQYGDGGGRRVLMFSALDCPICQLLENKLMQLQGSLDTTFYVVPASLRPMQMPAGQQAWQIVSRLWCAPDNGQVWRQFWAGQGQMPQAREACAFIEPQQAFNAYMSVHAALLQAGSKARGTPAMFLEDGSLLTYQTSRSDAEWLRVLGPQGAPAPAKPAKRWLAQ